MTSPAHCLPLVPDLKDLKYTNSTVKYSKAGVKRSSLSHGLFLKTIQVIILAVHRLVPLPFHLASMTGRSIVRMQKDN
ncbi:hypothetical protein DRQ21_11265 [Candidatus Fermentibacteria bacterium]|nr:MAG: hypothetical protein DRQ21_11265 [Candidatus Fermentibacteria bacterium]